MFTSTSITTCTIAPTNMHILRLPLWVAHIRAGAIAPAHMHILRVVSAVGVVFGHGFLCAIVDEILKVAILVHVAVVFCEFVLCVNVLLKAGQQITLLA